MKQDSAGQMKTKDKISFEDYLISHGTLTYTNVGTSMMPLLRQGRDLLTVTRKSTGGDVAKNSVALYKAGDVVLYKRRGRYVLHRIIGVRENDYVILGDNCVTKEYGITDADILGIMTGYVHGRSHSTDEPGYRVYTWVILNTIPVRVFLKRLRGILGRIARNNPWNKTRNSL